MVNTKKQHVALGQRIREILDDTGISQRELSRKLKVGPNQVSRWVLGAVAPTYTVINDILKICRKQHLTNWVLTGEGKSDRTGQTSDVETQSILNSNNREDELYYRNLYEDELRSNKELQERIIQLLDENIYLKDSFTKKPSSLESQKKLA